MAWVKLDDGFADHPKTIAAGPHAVALFVTGCCWSSANLTDGRLPKHVVPVLCAKAGVKPAAASRLVEVGFWHDRGDCYEIHDYLDRNPSRTQVEKERARWRGYKRGSTAESASESNGDSTAESALTSTADSAPSRPDPYPIDLHPPTTDSRLPSTGREVDVMKHLVKAERDNSGPVNNRRAWERTVTERLTAEHGNDIRRLVDQYPTAPPDVIAGHIRGETTTLRYHERKAPA